MLRNPNGTRRLNVNGNVMTRIIIIIITLLTFISCSNEKVTLNKEEYQSEYTKELKNRIKTYKQTKKIANDFLASIPDTSEAKLWEEQMSHNFSETFYIMNKIEEISYVLMLQADSMPFYNMDTIGPEFLKNFNESENTVSLLNHGLNKVISQYIAKHDAYMADTIYYNPIKISKALNEHQATKFWADHSKKINSLAEFQIEKEKLYYELFAILDKRVKFYIKTYNDRQKHSH
jgi:hypothetical protein